MKLLNLSPFLISISNLQIEARTLKSKSYKAFNFKRPVVNLKSALTTSTQYPECSTQAGFCDFGGQIGVLTKNHLMNEKTCTNKNCCFQPLQLSKDGVNYIGNCYAMSQEEWQEMMGSSTETYSNVADSGHFPGSHIFSITDNLPEQSVAKTKDLPPIEKTLNLIKSQSSLANLEEIEAKLNEIKADKSPLGSEELPPIDQVLSELGKSKAGSLLGSSYDGIKSDDEDNADKIKRVFNRHGELVTISKDATTEQLQEIIKKQSSDLNHQLRLFEMILDVLIKNSTEVQKQALADSLESKRHDSSAPMIDLADSNSNFNHFAYNQKVTYETKQGIQFAIDTGYNAHFPSMEASFIQGLKETCSAFRSLSVCCKNSKSPFCHFTTPQNTFKTYWKTYTSIDDPSITSLQRQTISSIYDFQDNQAEMKIGRPIDQYANLGSMLSRGHRLGKREADETQNARAKRSIGDSIQMGEFIDDDQIDQMDTSHNITDLELDNQGQLQSRIVGGSNALSSDLKSHMAYMYLSYSNMPFCGGTLVNDRWVISAAHCVTTYCSGESNLEEVRVMLGKYYRDAWRPNDGQDFGVISVICHRENCKASGEPRINDMALIKLDRKVNYQNYPNIVPAKLPSKYDEPILFKDCITLGWGASTTNGYGSEEYLKMAKMPIYSNYQCNQPDWRGCTIRSGMMCAGSADDRPCKGDSGGPLFCPYRGNEDEYVLQGVYSYGRCNRVLKKPAVYTRVSYYLDWILDTIAEN